MSQFNGKRILITGVTSAIGLAIAEEILKSKGTVVGTFRTFSNKIEDLSSLGNFSSFSWDSKETPDFLNNQSAFDGWVHCIGTIHPHPIKYLNKVSNQELFDVNYFSATLMSSQLLQRSLLNLSSSVVFISSVSSHFPYRGGASYAASKAALESFAKALALECSSKKIRVNTLVCALIKTPMFDATIASLGEKEIERIEKKYPLGFGDPSDIAKPCIFLLSDDAKWITGSQLLLDGGMMLNV